MAYTTYIGRTPQPGERQSDDRRSPEYAAWANMHTRCRNRRYRQWRNYGGRGIRVCARWSRYDFFLKDMGRMPARGWTLDRVNNQRHYAPNNCRWLPRHLNRRHTYTRGVPCVS